MLLSNLLRFFRRKPAPPQPIINVERRRATLRKARKDTGHLRMLAETTMRLQMEMMSHG